MVCIRRAATFVVAISLAAAATAATASPECKKACNGSFQQCLSGGGSDDNCRRTWFQCKKKCDPPAQSSAPAPTKGSSKHH